MSARPPHHDPAGGFRDPWPDGAPFPGRGDFWRWQWQRLRRPRAPDPAAEAMPRAEPDPYRPRGAGGTLSVTCVGHATTLLQVGPVNVLTDPVWSRRVSPLRWVGPGRLVPPGLAFEALPPVDVVVLSHDHYDHLDDPTVRRLARVHPGALWVTPLGYGPWLRRRGVVRHVELDWWEETVADTAGGTLTVRALPARHWTQRTPWNFRRRLWAAFSLTGPGGERAYFGGDSGWTPGFHEVGARETPYDLVLLPIGAYEPRWFMRSSHMGPEEAVRAYQALGGEGVFVGLHWGVFRLADEPVLEPPALARDAWLAAGLPESNLALAPPGGTVRTVATASGDP